MRRTISNLIYRFGIHRISEKARKKPVFLILAYHRVSPPEMVSPLLGELCVTPAAFESQMQYLTRYYSVLPLERLAEMIRGSQEGRLCEPLGNYAAITFDDGYRDNYEYAFPILKRHKLPASIFIPTSFVGGTKKFWWEEFAFLVELTQKIKINIELNGRSREFQLTSLNDKKKLYDTLAGLLKYMPAQERIRYLNGLREQLAVSDKFQANLLLSAEQIQEMQKHRITFGAHGHEHEPFSKLSSDALDLEISESNRILSKLTGALPREFAYPFGQAEDFNHQTTSALQTGRYSCALTMVQGVNKKGTDLYKLKRIGIGGFDDEAVFALKLSGVMQTMSKFKSNLVTHADRFNY